MKLFNLKKVRIIAFCLSLTYFASCEKGLDINQDPNRASTATPALVLPAAQVEMALPLSRDWNFIGSMWGQYWTGGHGVGSSFLEFYTMQSVDVEGAWTRAYARCLADIDFLKKSGQPIYAGMGRIMEAYFYQMLTDLHGDVPFSEAIKGAIEDGSILTPKFDTPESIYDALIPMLDQGIAEVQESGTGILEPGAEDLMYGGDIDKWITLANTIKLKVLVRRGNYAAARTLMNAGTVFIGDGEDAQITWNETPKNTNPLWARFWARVDVGMYYVSTTSSIDTLVASGDPRVDYFYTAPTLPAPASPHLGMVAGDVNDDPFYVTFPSSTASASDRRKYFSNVNDGVFSETTPTIFVSAWESKFLQSEVLIRTGGDGTAMFEAAVQSSFDWLGAPGGPAHIASLAFGGSVDNQLNILGLQKWISMNGVQMAEGWLESLRFDRPGNLIFTGGPSATPAGVFTSPRLNTIGLFEFPTSFVYPTQEISLNPNTPNRVVTDIRFWNN